jgi:predicted molibdopterin-dependent oxidoreductase YjgC
VQKALGMAFGTKSHTISMKAALGKDVILIVESDISTTHPVYALNILQAKREGAKLIVADARQTKLTRHSTSHLKMLAGTSVAFLNGIMKTIIDKDLFNRQIVSKTEGFDAFEKSLADYTPEKVSKITGIPETELVTSAEELAKAKNRMISLTINISENTKGMDTILAAANLVLLLGDDPETLQIPAEYANTFGMVKMGIQAGSGLKGISDMLYEQGSVRSLIIMGEDPVSVYPFSSKIQSVLKSLDLLIVQDIALTETAKLAHIVLPAASWAEKDGTFINAEGITQKLQRIVEAQGQSLPDWQILRNLSLAMGKEIGTRSVEGLSEEIRKTVRDAVSASDRRVFHAVDFAPGETPSAEYPFSLVIRDVLQHSGTMSTRSKSLDLVVSEAYLEINDEDATKLAVKDNSHVKVSSRRGTIYLKAKVTDAVPAGSVFSSSHFPHGRVNALLYYPENGASNPCAVKVETAKG